MCKGQRRNTSTRKDTGSKRKKKDLKPSIQINNMLESTLKTKAKKELEKAGWLVIHLIQTNMNGIPDTMILKGGRAVFIEFKRLGKEARELQEYRIKQLTKYGFEALVIDDMEGVKKFL
jgi:hypothetical protein